MKLILIVFWWRAFLIFRHNCKYLYSSKSIFNFRYSSKNLVTFLRNYIRKLTNFAILLVFHFLILIFFSDIPLNFFSLFSSYRHNFLRLSLRQTFKILNSLNLQKANLRGINISLVYISTCCRFILKTRPKKRSWKYLFYIRWTHNI